MSQRYPGGVITKTPTAPTQTAATGVWTLEQVAENVKNSTWPPNGPYFVEDVFSTYLYTGNGSTQTITNNIDLSGKGGLVWIKNRAGAVNHALLDTSRGVNKWLVTNNTDGETTNSGVNFAFNSTGFSMNNNFSTFNDGGAGQIYTSWTFRKQPKFFDVVTYTGNGTAGRAISHNLGSTPGCIIVKRLASAENWAVWHRGLTAGYWMELNNTNPATNAASGDVFGNGTTYVAPTSTQFTVGSENRVNDVGSDYIAYVFAHDAGGFGTSGNDSIISCGSYTGNGSATGPEINLGWEPQWVMIKRAISASTGNWFIFDNMRGLTVDQEPYLYANASSAEFSPSNFINPTSTGFNLETSGGSVNASGDTYIYIAIRRGPMKTPTTGTDVYNGTLRTGTGSTSSFSVGFAPDLLISAQPGKVNYTQNRFYDKIRGTNKFISSTNTSAQSTDDGITFNNTGYALTSTQVTNTSSQPNIFWSFRRAPGFFDIVSYIGTGSVRTLNHNLGVVPELMIVKRVSGVANWPVYAASNGNTKYQYLNTTAAVDTFAMWNDTSPTSSVFSVGADTDVNGSGSRYVAYLFASVPGVSKIGTVNVTGAAINVDCGFTTGARFVLMKRTSSTGPWLVWDSARGIVAGNDPYLKLNSTQEQDGDGAADFIDPLSSGFTIAAGAIDGYYGTGDYIYLAIA